MAEELVAKDNVSLQLLKELFESAYYNVKEDTDGELCIQGKYRYWVALDDSKRFIRFVSRFNTNEKTTPAVRIGYTNLVSRDMIVLRAYLVEDKMVVFDHHIWLDGGVTKKNIVMTLKMFEDLVQGAIARDKENVL